MHAVAGAGARGIGVETDDLLQLQIEIRQRAGDAAFAERALHADFFHDTRGGNERGAVGVRAEVGVIGLGVVVENRKGLGGFADDAEFVGPVVARVARAEHAGEAVVGVGAVAVVAGATDELKFIAEKFYVVLGGEAFVGADAVVFRGRAGVDQTGERIDRIEDIERGRVIAGDGRGVVVGGEVLADREDLVRGGADAEVVNGIEAEGVVAVEVGNETRGTAHEPVVDLNAGGQNVRHLVVPPVGETGEADGPVGRDGGFERGEKGLLVVVGAGARIGEREVFRQPAEGRRAVDHEGLELRVVPEMLEAFLVQKFAEHFHLGVPAHAPGDHRVGIPALEPRVARLEAVGQIFFTVDGDEAVGELLVERRGIVELGFALGVIAQGDRAGAAGFPERAFPHAIEHTARGVRAVDEGGGALEHFEPFKEKRFRAGLALRLRIGEAVGVLAAHRVAADHDAVADVGLDGNTADVFEHVVQFAGAGIAQELLVDDRHGLGGIDERGVGARDAEGVGRGVAEVFFVGHGELAQLHDFAGRSRGRGAGRRRLRGQNGGGQAERTGQKTGGEGGTGQAGTGYLHGRGKSRRRWIRGGSPGRPGPSLLI